MRARTALALLPADLVRVGRDELLVWMPAVPLVMALALRIGLRPGLEAAGLGRQAAETWIARLDVLAFGALVPVLIGAVVGFLLLGEKEERVWDALAVTPVSLPEYLAWRAAGATLASGVACGLCLVAGGLNDLGATGILAVASAAAPLGGATALALAVWTTGTIQGFAAVKLGFVLLILPGVLPAVAPQGPAVWATVLIPTWWPVQAYEAATAGRPEAVWAVGAAAVGLVMMGAALATVGARRR